ncbi:MAG: hypothetical protein ACI32O_11475 [Enterococcus sp.]
MKIDIVDMTFTIVDLNLRKLGKYMERKMHTIEKEAGAEAFNSEK